MQSDQHNSPRERLAGLAGVAIAGLIWGSIPLLLHAAEGSSVVKVFFRVAFAAAAIAPYMLLTGRMSELGRLPRAVLVGLIGQGLILALNWFLFFTALDLTDVAVAELLGYTGPVFVAVLAPLVTAERFDLRILAPLLLSLFGIVVILVPHGIELGGGRQLLGAALAAASAVTYAILLLRSKKLLRGVSAFSVMLVEYLVSGVVLLPFVLRAYAVGDVPVGFSQYAALVALGVFNTALAGLLFFRGLRRVRTDQVAVLTYIEPASAVLFAAAFLGERLTVPTVVGGVMVITGGIAVALMEARAGVETLPLETGDAYEGAEPSANETEGSILG